MIGVSRCGYLHKFEFLVFWWQTEQNSNSNYLDYSNFVYCMHVLIVLIISDRFQCFKSLYSYMTVIVLNMDII